MGDGIPSSIQRFVAPGSVWCDSAQDGWNILRQWTRAQEFEPPEKIAFEVLLLETVEPPTYPSIAEKVRCLQALGVPVRFANIVLWEMWKASIEFR